jgi:hypothetical protein
LPLEHGFYLRFGFGGEALMKVEHALDEGDHVVMAGGVGH